MTLLRVAAALAVGFCILAIGTANEVLPESECLSAVDAFLQRRFSNLLDETEVQKKKQYHSDDFLFFLHVPRTAGRSFWSCFLYRAYPATEKCVKSYDSLRLELSRPDCRLLASHDDYSIVDFLPENFKVITQARDPVDRVISAYEFTAVVASRDLNPNVTKLPDETEKVKTRDVWPWLYLIQLFDRYTERVVGLFFQKQSIFKQEHPKEYEESLDAWVESISKKSGRTYYYHRKTRESKWELTEEERKKLLPMLDPYNNSLIIPLATFVEFPMAEELVNNAMTYQVLGLSNASYWEEAAEIRKCSVHSRRVQEKLLEAAKAQMDRMLHISLTHRLDESLRSVAGTLNLNLSGPAWGGQPVALPVDDATETQLSLESCRENLTHLTDTELLQLLFKYRTHLDESRSVARSRRKSQLTKREFLPKWDTAVANLEYVREIQAEVLRRRKEKGESFTTYPEKTEDRNKKQSPFLLQCTSAILVYLFLELPLWAGYVRCLNTTMKKMRFGKIRAMTNLALPDERRPYFTKKARANIPQSTIDLIREKNWMDVELYTYAVQLYEAHLKFQRENDLLPKIPKYNPNATEEPPPDPPPKPLVHEEL